MQKKRGMPRVHDRLHDRVHDRVHGDATAKKDLR